MNSFSEFKRLLRNSKIKYEIFENKEKKKIVFVEQFARLRVTFLDDGYCEAASPYRYMKGLLGQNRGTIEVCFPAYTVNDLLEKLLRYKYVTVDQVRYIVNADSQARPAPKKKKRVKLAKKTTPTKKTKPKNPPL